MAFVAEKTMDMWLLEKEYLESRENYTTAKPYKGETRLIHRYFSSLNALFCNKALVGFDAIPFVPPVKPVLIPYTIVEAAGTAEREEKNIDFKAKTDIWMRKTEAIPVNAQKAMGLMKGLLSLEIQTELDAIIDALPPATTEIERLQAMLNHMKDRYSPTQSDEINRIRTKLQVVNDYCGIEMFFNVLEDITLLLKYVEAGAYVPTSDAMRDLIPGVCHNPSLVFALEQMRSSAAWAGYTYRQAKDAILKMARRNPEMLLGAVKDKKEGSAKSADRSDKGGRGGNSGGRGTGVQRGGRGGTGGRFGGKFQGSLTSSRPEMECWNCNGKGHLARDCPLPKKERGQAKLAQSSGNLGSSASSDRVKCTYCEKAHVGGVSNCWKKAFDEMSKKSGKSSKRTRIQTDDQEEDGEDEPARSGRRT
jgi:hypothetical protein